MEGYSTIILLVLMIGIFYFMLIRPENKKKKEVEAMRNAVAVGDEITTIGGIHGVICHIKDDLIVIETGADRVRMELQRWAISTNDTAAARSAEAEKEAKALREAEAREKRLAKQKKKEDK
jgi:preprotein translocase subunit YajC